MPHNRVIGLDIGTSAVRAAEVDIKKNPPVLVRFGQMMLPPGAVVDGEVVDPQAVGATIGNLWKRVGFHSKSVIVGVANQRVIVRQVEMPYMEEAELEAGLAFQVQDHLPIDVVDALLDFQILEELTTEDNIRMIRVLLVAAQRDMIEAVLQALQVAGLEPTCIDLQPLALLRTLGGGENAVGDEESAEAIVDLGAGITNIVVHTQGIPRFVRILVSGGQRVTDALASALLISEEEAELLKRQETSSGTPEVARRIIDDRASIVLEEIRGSLDYYAAQRSSAPLSRVVITGGASCMPGLVPKLELATGITTECGHPLANLKLGDLGLTAEQLIDAEPIASVPVGLALGEKA